MALFGGIFGGGSKTTTTTTVSNEINIDAITQTDIGVGVSVNPEIQNTLDLSGLAGPLDRMAEALRSGAEASATASAEGMSALGDRLAVGFLGIGAGIAASGKASADATSAVAAALAASAAEEKESPVADAINSTGKIAGALLAFAMLYFLFRDGKPSKMEFAL